MNEELQRFEAHVAASPELKQKVADAIGDLNKLAELAKQEGYKVTFEDFKSDLKASVATYRDKPAVKAFVAEHPETHRFYYKAFNDEGLHSRFMAADGDVNKLATLATKEGFDLDAAKIQAYRDGLIEATSTGELSDDELDAVAGGGFFGALMGVGAGAIGGFVGGFVTSVAEGNSLSSSFETGKNTMFVAAAIGLVTGASAPEP
jgi:predicted ribosomally synthesized peptide with nif11-like leader